ncbi:MAG: ferredoxin [Prochloraceae cyanobacterium]
MSEFKPWVKPLNRKTIEKRATGWSLEYEDFPCNIDVTGPLLYTLFQKNWQEIQIGHVVEGSVLELEFTQPPKICILYDGYLTVVTEAWHLHLCLEPHLGGPHSKTPLELRKRRLVSRAAFYRHLNPAGKARGWGIQFWNGDSEKMMSLFLPNIFLGEEEDLLAENKPQLEKLGLYQELREIYVLGKSPIPFSKNPLKRPYISVCRSSRCNPPRNWQPIFNALETAVKEAKIDVEVGTAGCLEVCKKGPVVFYSEDRTWYSNVTPEVAKEIVNRHLVKGEKLKENLYPQLKT